MSDYASGLPIRSEADGTDERVHTKIVDFTSPAGVDKQMEVSEKLAHIRNFGQDPAGTKVQLRLSQEGFANANGDYDGTTNTRPSSQGVILHDRVATPAQADQNFRPTGVASSDGSNAKAADVAIRDENGNAFTTSNPLPVTMVDSEGVEVNDFKQDASVAANASVNHDYTVTALKTMKLQQIEASGSGKMKLEVQAETAAASGVFTTKWVLFNSTANPNISLWIKELLSQVAGAKIRLIKTNLDNQPQNLYSTISGHEI